MAELHSITGLFYERFPGISPWGGYFIRDEENGIEGRLVDIYGISKITGKMDERLLSFVKQYRENRGQAFDYKFSLKNGIWLGEFVSIPPGYSEKSICKTSLCLGDLDVRHVDMSTEEGFDSALIDSMIEDGKLKKFKDPETGEEMLRPLK